MMKTSKKILAIFISIAGLTFVSACTAWAGNLILGIPYSAIFVATFILQIVGWKIWDILIEKAWLKTELQEIAKKPFREYVFPLYCQHCTTQQPVVISDLNNIEFDCTFCKKSNSVQVGFNVFAKSNEINELDVRQRLQQIHDNV